MGFALWIDRANRLAWARGTQEYRAMGAAVIAMTGQFRHKDFQRRRVCPRELEKSFEGYFGSLEEVNQYLKAAKRGKGRVTPPYVY
jgi:hypothetical protein